MLRSALNVATNTNVALSVHSSGRSLCFSPSGGVCKRISRIDLPRVVQSRPYTAATGIPTTGRNYSRGSMGAFASKESYASDDLFLIVGLGNPGGKYRDNRHNVGFLALDQFAAFHGIDFKGLQKNCHVARGYVHGSRVLLAKPMTFMNNSGEGVSQLMKYYKVPLERVIVLTDDMDTPSGKVKLKRNGGHGGQNGIRSIIDLVGSKEFARVKIGIGRPSEGQDVVGHVLSNFTVEEKEKLPGQFEDVRGVLEAVVALGLEKALSGVRVGDEEKKRKRRAERLARKKEMLQEDARVKGENGAVKKEEHAENEPANKKQEVERVVC
jgi:PTH1 family peptidyl-tRNA hydrolase